MMEKQVCGPEYSEGLVRRCKRLSLATQSLSVAMGVLGLFFFFLVATNIAGLLHTDRSFIPEFLVCIWLVWAALYLTNIWLIRCGDQALRFKYSSRWINRPENYVRLAFHLLINWSAVLLTLIGANFLDKEEAAESWIYTMIGVTFLLFIFFNFQHRRMNRRRNLLMTGCIASSIIGFALLLLGL
jgi:hypothetical protein